MNSQCQEFKSSCWYRFKEKDEAWPNTFPVYYVLHNRGQSLASVLAEKYKWCTQNAIFKVGGIHIFVIET